MQTDPKLVALRRGLLEPLVLAAVESQQRYAAEILAALQEAGFPAQEGTLYPLLSKLRRDGLVHYEWRESPSGPPRKYFSLTDAGRGQLAAFREYWNELTHVIDTIGR
ncbi:MULTISPECIES: PadR family transcriptional regulator [Micromonospora]|uniref:PadR family transcriptional regulator n=1 Tax=Micromonospora TaxID=1873 RepID=UPI001B3826A5|nr:MULTISPECIES: PadR family transcriptional regulator [Micromonospora]MBQ1016776.1 PadR family transcriptional regulator [Micromonospora sp. D93]WSG34568.1 PadR family transcriptional regulator [Micromonospora ureilytica]